MAAVNNRISVVKCRDHWIKQEGTSMPMHFVSAGGQHIRHSAGQTWQHHSRTVAADCRGTTVLWMAVAAASEEPHKRKAVWPRASLWRFPQWRSWAVPFFLSGMKTRHWVTPWIFRPFKTRPLRCLESSWTPWWGVISQKKGKLTCRCVK